MPTHKAPRVAARVRRSLRDSGVVRFRAVILTALPVEYEAVRDCLKDLEPRVHQGTHYEIGHVTLESKTWEILLVEIGPGNAAGAAEAERALSYHDAELALFVGVAGGLKDVRIGDVVAGESVYGYHSGKAAAHFQPRPSVGHSAYSAVQAAREVRRRWERRGSEGPKAFVGKIASGEEVVTSTRSPTARRLRRTYGDALAVEMESWGFLTAARMRPHVPALVIRGISDLVDGKAAADRRGSQTRASAIAAEFAMSLLGVYEPPRPGNP